MSFHACFHSKDPGTGVTTHRPGPFFLYQPVEIKIKAERYRG